MLCYASIQRVHVWQCVINNNDHELIIEVLCTAVITVIEGEKKYDEAS